MDNLTQVKCQEGIMTFRFNRFCSVFCQFDHSVRRWTCSIRYALVYSVLQLHYSDRSISAVFDNQKEICEPAENSV